MKQLLIKSSVHHTLSGIILFFFLFFPQNFQAQETITNRFEFSVAYGSGYTRPWGQDFGSLPGDIIVVETSSKIIGAFEVSFSYRLKENRYIGLTYSKLNYSNTLNVSRYFWYYNAMIILENFKNINTYQNFGIEFRQEFIPRLHFGVGFSYFVRHVNSITIGICDGIPCFTGEGWMQRLDDLALSASLEYYFPVKSYFQIGIRTKGFLTLAGFEAITLTPALKFSF